jgi:hypothetical protein
MIFKKKHKRSSMAALLAGVKLPEACWFIDNLKARENK